MKVAEMVKWLQTQDQNLEVCVVEGYYENGDFYTTSVCFDDVQTQSSKTEMCLILGVE